MNIKRIALSLCAACAVVVLGWVGGFDFNERGYAAFMVAALAVWVGAAVYCDPGWKKQ